MLLEQPPKLAPAKSQPLGEQIDTGVTTVETAVCNECQRTRDSV